MDGFINKKEIHVNSSTGFEELESIISQVICGNCNMILAKDIKCNKAGLEVRLIQAIITWAHKNSSSNLMIAGSEDIQDAVAAYTGRPYGLCALLSERPVFIRQTNKNASDIASVESNSALDQQNKGHIWPIRSDKKDQQEFLLGDVEMGKLPKFKGTEVFILCADKSRHSYNRFLYSDTNSGTVRNPEEFETMPLRILDGTANRGSLKNVPMSALRNFGSVLYELFSNTHKHARKNEHEKAIVNSLRGVFSKAYSLEEINSNASSEDDYWQKYINSLKKEFGKFKLFEISVFDSGIGLSNRYCFSKRISPEGIIENEYNSILKCFQLNCSSSGIEGRGQGLFRVQQALTDAKGLLTLRTGRLNLYRDFLEEPFNPTKGIRLNEDGYFFRSLKSDSGNQHDSVEAFGEVQGAALTALIPIPIQA